MKTGLILLMIALSIATGSYGNELEIIELRHRRAEELLPVIRPLLDKDEMVSGMNYQLILRASPHNTGQIRRLLERIDTLPRQLKITVMQNVDSETVARLTEISGSVSVGRNARISVSGGVNAGGVSKGQGGVSARIISTRSLEDDQKTQHLQVLDGNRAWVSSGQSVPVPQRQLIQQPWGTQVIETVRQSDIASGFYVLPRVSGDRVTLEITTQNDSLIPNQHADAYPNKRIQNTSSTVSGRLGEWINLGGLSQQSDFNNATLTARSTSRLNEQRNMLIRVEEVD
ncbi:MAG: hypothetical protein Q7U78_05045 [Gallionella sp.]|nr:hypothetical protein [Gallionella sp.]